MYDWAWPAWPWSIGRAGPGLPCQPHRDAEALSGCLGSDKARSVTHGAGADGQDGHAAHLPQYTASRMHVGQRH
jgi:hypothetical protein